MVHNGERWTLANILPVGFMLSFIFTIWILYLWLHALPMVGPELAAFLCRGEVSGGREMCRERLYMRGVFQGVTQSTLTVLMLICFARAIMTDPGSVPHTSEWMGGESDAKIPEASGAKARRRSREAKQTGARRYCKWCVKYKPDRAHHCRVCRSCVLRMDHHCPWIANCVGFGNHKFFFLLVLYSLLDCFFVIFTISESLSRSMYEETVFINRFLLVFCTTLSSLMGICLSLFLAFHTHLMLRATTTIEFCEKTYRSSIRGPQKSFYDRGAYENIKAVLGPYVLFWGLPWFPPVGDGLYFAVSDELSAETDDEASPLLRSGAGSSSDSGPAAKMSAEEEDIENPKDDSIKAKDDLTACVTSKRVTVSSIASFEPAAPEVTGTEEAANGS